MLESEKWTGLYCYAFFYAPQLFFYGKSATVAFFRRRLRRVGYLNQPLPVLRKSGIMTFETTPLIPGRNGR
jgi:hypothetical protein